MLQLADVKAGDVVYDLGCGDGRVVITAAQEFGATGVGIELDESRARKARSRVRELGLDGQVTILHEDLFNVDLDGADVVTLYLTTSANDRVKPKLEMELKPGARVVSHGSFIGGWIPQKIEKVYIDLESYSIEHVIYLYKSFSGDYYSVYDHLT
jgi:tRNA A58 N-methylase Trm61